MLVVGANTMFTTPASQYRNVTCWVFCTAVLIILWQIYYSSKDYWNMTVQVCFDFFFLLGVSGCMSLWKATGWLQWEQGRFLMQDSSLPWGLLCYLSPLTTKMWNGRREISSPKFRFFFNQPQPRFLSDKAIVWYWPGVVLFCHPLNIFPLALFPLLFCHKVLCSCAMNWIWEQMT